MKKKIGVIILIILGLLVVGGFTGNYIITNKVEVDTIYPGISVDGIDISNKTKDEALKLIKDKKELDKEETMTLSSGENTYTMALDEIGYDYNYDEVIDQAYDYGRDGTVYERYKEIRTIEREKINLNLESSYDKDKVKEVVDKVSNNLDIESKDAVFNFNGGNFQIEPEVDGSKVQREKLGELIEANIEELAGIEIPMETVKSTKTKAQYERINGVIGQYSTAFPRSSQGRKKNIAISADALNGQVLHPGETLSYNAVTGPRQRQYGYEEAPVIINGDLTPGVGGGVCQTSTTLYNALLLADLTITERAPHSIAPGYVSKGTDAAVADGYLDLKFRNDFDYPIYFSSWTANDQVHIAIYGDKANRDYTVRIEPELVETIAPRAEEKVDTSLPAGQKQVERQGRTGYKVKTFKSIIKDGQVVERKQITGDYYRERNALYRVGQ